MYVARAIEFAHACDGFRDVARCLLDRMHIAAAALAQAGLLFEHRVGVEHDRRDRIVDVVRNAARHLAESPQTLLLHRRELRLPQNAVCSLELSGTFGHALFQPLVQTAYGGFRARPLFDFRSNSAFQLRRIDGFGSCKACGMSFTRRIAVGTDANAVTALMLPDSQ